MFVRKNKNRSGSVSVQIVSKEGGKFKVIKSVGSSRDRDEIEKIHQKAKNLIASGFCTQKSLFPISKDEINIENFLEDLSNENIRVIGPELIFGKIFNSIGFNAINDELFKHLVITRLVYPGSKLKTVDYLNRYKGVNIQVDTIYRFLDKLHSKHKEWIEQIAFEHTKKTLGGDISVAFYDMTTLYFEAEDEDDLRKIGFSKDGKFQCPQIMIGLLVGEKGYPIGYDIFEGNTFEGHTLIPILEKFQKKFKLAKPVIVADSGLLSRNNIELLQKKEYPYIIGARIKNEKTEIKKKILELDFSNESSAEIKKDNQVRLVVTYSDKRARKDAYNREKGLKRLEKKVQYGKLTKTHINNRGYNKYLKLNGQVAIAIDYGKFENDSKWDGLKGYITNTKLTADDIIENYGNLWQIEKAFRISKTDLKVRPIFHRLRKRIEAHICISFVAYSIYKELEKILNNNNAPFSVKRAGELTHTMYEIKYTLPKSLKEKRMILKMSDEQNILHEIIKKY